MLLMEIGARRGQHWLVLFLFIFGVSGKPDRRLSGRLQSLSGAVISSDRTRVAQCPHQSMPCGLDWWAPSRSRRLLLVDGRYSAGISRE
jgi:hypothetical protein